MDDEDQAWAVFRCRLLGPLLLGEILPAEQGNYFQELSQQEHLLPNGKRRRHSARTWRRWYQRLRIEGVLGGVPRRRADRGQAQLKHRELLARAVQLKIEQPRRSHRVLKRILYQEFGIVIPKSTLYRHLRLAGATRQQLGLVKEPIRCRWTRDHTNALWVGDFSHGPIVMHQGQPVKTHLSIWIDCYSRYVVEARYYIRENLDILVDSLLRAWTKHGASRELYVDNAKIYWAHALLLACTELNIKLLHRPPRDPPAGGLIERVIQTIQSQLEAEVRAASVMTLVDLNRDLQAWLENAYHAELHSEIRETPVERYAAGNRFHRHVDLKHIVDFFRKREVRTVDKTFCDVRIEGLFFAVAQQLRGSRVIVKYDPFQPLPELQEVDLLSEAGVYLGVGRRYVREKGHHAPPPPTPPTEPIDPHYLKALRAAQEAQHEQQRQQGIDYFTAQERARWDWTGFATTLARLLGRSGGLSAFQAEELEALRSFHSQHERVNEALLREAFQQAESQSIPTILFHVRNLLLERNS